MSDPREILPLERPPDVTVEVPGSKSLTNRALAVAALAAGTSELTGALFADDTWAMIEALQALGVTVTADPEAARITVTGTGGELPRAEASLDVRLSGTTARFVAPMLALGHGRYRLDGAPPFRRRPMGPVVDALRQLGVGVVELGEPGRLPVEVVADGLVGGRVAVAGDASSQFLSGLLMAGPLARAGLQLALTTPLVSEPYVAMTIRVMADFGVQVGRGPGDVYVVPPGAYRARSYAVEPDASAASYFLAAAAITGGRVRVAGLRADSVQGDAAFARVLARMGAEVTVDEHGTEVRGTGRLEGIEVDLGELSDTAQTLASVAVFARTPTRITGIGFIRAKETDRIAATVTELRRCGIDAQEEPDGLVIRPGTPHGALIRTYDDHRVAMSFALLGLRVPGIRLADPDCVAKTFPRFYAVLDHLRVHPSRGDR